MDRIIKIIIKNGGFKMMKSKELRARAWESLKGKYWMAFAVIIVTGLIASIGNCFVSFGQYLQANRERVQLSDSFHQVLVLI